MSEIFIPVLHITPTVDELLNTTELRCSVDGCLSVFKNYGNLQMHLRKHHKLPAINSKDVSQKIFFCPVKDCPYFDHPSNEKNFKGLKFLKQHFQKVHAEKKFNCCKCFKAFGTESMRDAHTKNCGREYICAECGWKYDTSEALLTHIKRKGHNAKPSTEQKPEPKPEPKVVIPKLPKPEKSKPIIFEPKDCQTQTELDAPEIILPPKKRKFDFLPEVNIFNESPFCNIETQTELNMISGLNDPMLYSNMCTQTCDEFLSELGLADIQTQTNWTAIDDDDRHSKNDRFSSVAHDELMVSTETQTSFTQCLLDSCNEDNSLTGNITQHTQTCDTLLEGLFGAQDSDFIGSFQSTHTQT